MYEIPFISVRVIKFVNISGIVKNFYLPIKPLAEITRRRFIQLKDQLKPNTVAIKPQVSLQKPSVSSLMIHFHQRSEFLPS